MRDRAVLARVVIALGASALTHPVVFLVVPQIFYGPAALVHLGEPARYATMVAVAETYAVIVEALYLHAFGVRRAWAWALAGNAASVSVGLACSAIFGVP